MVLFRLVLITLFAVNLFTIGEKSNIAHASTEVADLSSLDQSAMSWNYVWFLGSPKMDERGIPVEIIDQGFANSFATALLDCQDAKARHGKGVCFVFPLPLPTS